MTKEFFIKGFTSSVAAGALGYVLTSQITNISLDVCVCVVLNVAVEGGRLIWLEGSPFSLDTDSSMSDGPHLKGIP